MAMTSVNTATARSEIDRLAAALTTVVDRYKKNRAVRRTLRELDALGNRELADLGLNRSSLNRVAYQAVYK